jgi:hypothetical protein
MASKAIPLDNGTGTGLSWEEIVDNDQDMTFKVNNCGLGTTLTLGLNGYSQTATPGDFLVPKADFKSIAENYETNAKGLKFVRVTYSGSDVSCSIGNNWVSAD